MEFGSKVNKRFYFFRFMGVDLSVPSSEECFVFICKCQTSVNTRHFMNFLKLRKFQLFKIVLVSTCQSSVLIPHWNFTYCTYNTRLTTTTLRLTMMITSAQVVETSVTDTKTVLLRTTLKRTIRPIDQMLPSGSNLFTLKGCLPREKRAVY